MVLEKGLVSHKPWPTLNNNSRLSKGLKLDDADENKPFSVLQKLTTMRHCSDRI